MKIIKKIMIFDNDKYFLFMLKGYCYANNVQMTEVKFNREGISEAQKVNPDLIFIPLDLISPIAGKSIESGLLKLTCKNKKIKICALNQRQGCVVSEELPEWIDMIIDDPLDIIAIDRFIKTVFVWSGYLPERRTNKERRINTDRRQCTFNDSGYGGSKGIKPQYRNYQPNEGGVCEAQDFHIDTRNKCLYLNGNRINLTPKEFELIEYLSTDPERIFTADEIVNHLWPENHRATKSDLYQYIHLLRKKIEKDHNQPQLVLNAKGFGYKLNVLSRQDSGATFASPGQNTGNTGKVTQMEPLKTTPALP
jgi:DNA-binding winged helix-turn-helix (wHTH) protein